MTNLKCIYDKYSDEKIVGVFNLGKPNVVIHDVDLIKLILVKDFDHFVDRRAFELHPSSDVREILKLTRKKPHTTINNTSYSYLVTVVSFVSIRSIRLR